MFGKGVVIVEINPTCRAYAWKPNNERIRGI
jgi:hypothetical protein